jgi:membrane-bound ClpP family serine protease
MIIKIIEIIAVVTLILSIYLCGIKPRLGWLIYIINALFYTFLMFYKGLIFMGISGIILGIIGIINFRKAKK